MRIPSIVLLSLAAASLAHGQSTPLMLQRPALSYGVAPDIEVEQDPALVRKGHDPQLEKAVEVLLEQLKKNPPPKHEKPAYPNCHRPTGR